LSTRRSLFFSFADRYASLLVSVGSSMLIARLLTPAEIGIFSITMVVVQLVSTVRDLGAGQYLVQARELSTAHIRSVWAVQLTLGVSLSLAVLALSYPMERVYGDNRIRDMMLILSISFLLNPFGSVTYAWLMREMRFDAIAVIRLGSTLTGALVSILLAWRGFGAASLAWGGLASTVASATLSVMYRPRGYPWKPSFAQARAVVSFGSKVTLTSIVNTLSKGTPEFVLGKLHGFAAAGFFSRANGLAQMFNRLVVDAVYNVAFAMFSREAREGIAPLASFLRATAYMCALAWSFAALVALMAEPIVRLLYGSQWQDSVALVRILCIALACTAPASLGYALLLARGHAGRAARLTLKTASIAIVAAIVGAYLGLAAVCWSLVLSAAVASWLWTRELKREIQLKWGQAWHVLWTSAVVALASALAPLAVVVQFGFRPSNALLSVTLAAAGAAIAFAIAARLVNHPIHEEISRAKAAVRSKLSTPRT
jgi:O-antigen/teichoic acid export membrane protein